jgi:hypothetical protein
MVGTLKRWLGIDDLERENVILVRAVQKLREYRERLEADARQTLEVALDCQTVYKDHETRLRAIEGEPKAEPKPKARTVPFRQFKAAAESLPEED